MHIEFKQLIYKWYAHFIFARNEQAQMDEQLLEKVLDIAKQQNDDFFLRATVHLGYVTLETLQEEGYLIEPTEVEIEDIFKWLFSATIISKCFYDRDCPLTKDVKKYYQAIETLIDEDKLRIRTNSDLHDEIEGILSEEYYGIFPIFELMDFQEVNWNASPATGEFMGESILLLLAFGAKYEDDVCASTLAALINRTEDLTQLNFNAKISSGDYAGTNVLWWIALRIIDVSQKMLPALINKMDDLTQFDFNACPSAGLSSGISVLYLLGEAATLGFPQSLLVLINKLTSEDLRQLDFNASRTVGSNTDVNVLWWIAKREGIIGDPEVLRPLINKLTSEDLTQLDFNAQPSEEPNAGESVLWLIAKRAALSDRPEALRALIDKMEDLTQLDFNAAARAGDNQGKTVLMLLEDSDFLFKIIFQRKPDDVDALAMNFSEKPTTLFLATIWKARCLRFQLHNNDEKLQQVGMSTSTVIEAQNIELNRRIETCESNLQKIKGEFNENELDKLHYWHGLYFYQAGLPMEALGCFNEIFEESSYYTNTCYRQAEIYYQLGMEARQEIIHKQQEELMEEISTELTGETKSEASPNERLKASEPFFINALEHLYKMKEDMKDRNSFIREVLMQLCPKMATSPENIQSVEDLKKALDSDRFFPSGLLMTLVNAINNSSGDKQEIKDLTVRNAFLEARNAKLEALLRELERENEKDKENKKVKKNEEGATSMDVDKDRNNIMTPDSGKNKDGGEGGDSADERPKLKPAV